MKTYLGFDLSHKMFNSDCIITRRSLSPDDVQSIVALGVESYIDPVHNWALPELRKRFGIEATIPDRTPKVTLGVGDSVIVVDTNGLCTSCRPHDFTPGEIAKATFAFTEFTVA